MLSSLYSGISGLLSNSTTLNVVGNNIANVNTVGYKSSSTIFSDVLYQTISSTGGGSQVGRGSSLSAVTTDFSQGSFETTTSDTDLAIGGSGFFIVQKEGSETLYYTRAGSFSLNSDGYMVDSNGYILQGKVIDSSTGTAYGVDTDIIISQEPSQPKQTSEIDMVLNLQSDSDWAGRVGLATVVGTGITSVGVTSGATPDDGTYTVSTVVDNGDGTYDVTITLPDTTTVTGTAESDETVSDFGSTGLDITFGDLSSAGAVGTTFTLGSAITGVTVNSGEYPAEGTYLISTVVDNGDGTYDVTITLPDTTTVTDTVEADSTVTDFGGSGLDITFGDLSSSTSGGFTLTEGTNYSSSITVYDSLGTAHTVTVNFCKVSESSEGQSVWEWEVAVEGNDVVASGGSGTLTFNNNGVLVSGDLPQSVTFDFAGAASGQVIDLVFDKSTQYPISSKTSSQSQDGYAPGTLENISVSSDGIISGTYDNGQIIELYQITLATFNNSNGLKNEGNNLYSATMESGYAYTTTPGDGGTGSLSSNSLEQSNVDLATEFVRMIVAQRGYEASSKVITTTDEVLQTLMNLKR